MKHKLIIGLSSIIAIALTGCNKQEEKQCQECETCTQCEECPEVAPCHEHTFSLDWEYNETHHWHNATCEHTSLTSDFSEHVFVNGVCACGYEEPTPEPIPEQTFFLPNTIKHYRNGLSSETSTFTYDEDLHGYKEIFVLNDPFFSSAVSEYIIRYNEDFSKMTYENIISYEEKSPDTGEIEKYSHLDSRELYEYFENGSYTVEKYKFDPDSKDLYFDGKNGYFFNEYGQEIIHYQLSAGDNLEDLPIFIYTETTYDVYHRISRYESYEGTFKNKYLDYYDVYDYDDVTNTGLRTTYQINFETKLPEIDGYGDIGTFEEDGVMYIAEQNRSASGELGNLNIYGYDALYRPVYLNYNESMISTLEENENYQITNYSYKEFSGWTIDLSATYNEDNLLLSTSREEVFSTSSKSVSYTKYIYNETKQLYNILSAYSYITDESQSIELDECEISYTSVESKELLERMDIYTNLYGRYSDLVFRDWIY